MCFSHHCARHSAELGSTKSFSISCTVCLSSNQEAVISAEMMGMKIYPKDSGQRKRWKKHAKTCKQDSLRIIEESWDLNPCQQWAEFLRVSHLKTIRVAGIARRKPPLYSPSSSPGFESQSSLKNFFLSSKCSSLCCCSVKYQETQQNPTKQPLGCK